MIGFEEQDVRGIFGEKQQQQHPGTEAAHGDNGHEQNKEAAKTGNRVSGGGGRGSARGKAKVIEVSYCGEEDSSMKPEVYRVPLAAFRSTKKTKDINPEATLVTDINTVSDNVEAT